MILWGGFIGILIVLIGVGGWIGRSVALVLVLIAIAFIVKRLKPKT